MALLGQQRVEKNIEIGWLSQTLEKQYVVAVN